MQDDIYVNSSGIYYNISSSLLQSLINTKLKIQYSLIIEYDKLRNELFEILSTFTLNDKVIENTIQLLDDRIMFTLICDCSEITILDNKIYFIKIDKTNNNSPEKLLAVDKFKQIFFNGYKETIVEEVTLSIML